MSHHATLSPSSFPAMDQCSCYKSKPGDSEASIEGTFQHRELECLIQGADPLSPGWTPGVLWAYEKIINGFDMHKTHSEYKLSLLRDFQEITYGTSDIVGRRNDGHLAVYDYKSGQQRDSSAQLAVYALMAMQKYGETECICLIGYGRDQWEESWILTLEEAERIVYGIIEKVQNDPQPSICEYCSWCEHSGNCSAETEAITTVAAGYEPETLDITAVETWHASEITDPVQMAKVYKVACVLAKWADSAKHHAKEAMMNGMVIPGYKKRNGSKVRKVDDIQGAYEASGMNPQEFLACCTVSVTALEEAIKEKDGLKGKALKSEVAQRFEKVIYIKENAASMVAEKKEK